MRHINRIINNQCRHVERSWKPWERPYTYARANKNRKYIQVLDYINKHPFCKRFDIICALYGFNKDRVSPRMVCGQASLMFSNLLYDDFIDYNSKYQYRLTSRGRNLLISAGVEA
jgi:hypothetical protein